MLPQVMHVSSQPGHLTGSEGSEQSFPVFAPVNTQPVMYIPQIQDQSFLFQNQQQVNQSALGGQTTILLPSPQQQPVTPEFVKDAGEEVEGEEKTLEPVNSTNTTPAFAPVTTEFPTMQLPLPTTVAPAQYVNPMVFPQVPMAQHQMPQFVPCVVPNGTFAPTFQPMYFVPQPNAPVFNQPEQHPLMRSDSSHSRHEPSKSYDGSEFSDMKSNSLRRFSSDHSKDGYGSDFWDNRSRMGSEQQFEDDDDKEEERQVKPQRYYQNNHYDHHGAKRQYRGRERSRSGSQKRPTSKERQEEMYKTELCSAWVNHKKCRFGHRCIFAHGIHELRPAKRKQDRQKMRAPLKKFMTGLLNKLCHGNYDQVMTEFMTVCLEEISDHNVNNEGADIMKAFFNKAVVDRELREDLVESLFKLFRSHPYADVLQKILSDVCFNEYSRARNKATGLSNIELVGLLVCRGVLDDQIVHKILQETQYEDSKQHKIEAWVKLMEILKNTVDTAKYCSNLAKFKSTSTRMRFKIMDLEELRKNNWNSRT